jgi:hypothetical protein
MRYPCNLVPRMMDASCSKERNCMDCMREHDKQPTRQRGDTNMETKSVLTSNGKMENPLKNKENFQWIPKQDI